jgi:hypothetical protein
VWLLIWAIDALKQGNKRLFRIIYHLKMKCESQYNSLATFEETLASCSQKAEKAVD